MAGNDSSTGGYLSPLDATPTPEDAGLDAQIQSLVAGITGLDGTLVRPRWQPIPPKQPAANVTWAAVAASQITPDVNAVVLHQSSIPPGGTVEVGSDVLQRNEIIEVLASFYGPNATEYAGLLQDGLSIAQNREAMFLANMGLVDVGSTLRTAELINQQFILRIDFTFRLRRMVIRTYPVLNIKSSQGTISDPYDNTSRTFDAETNL